MKEVTSVYRSDIEQGLRQNSFARVYFYNIDVDAAGDGRWTGNGETSWSDVSTLDEPYAYGDTIATLELNRWTLDGTQRVLPNNTADVHDGFVSNILTDQNGVPPDGSIPTLIRQFSRPHTFRGLTVTFDGRTREYPSCLYVEYYLIGERVDRQIVYPSNDVMEIPNNAPEVDRVEIYLIETLPYRRARFQYIMFGFRVLFENDDLIETRQTHDVDPISRRLPTEDFQFSVIDYQHRYDPDNPTGEWEFVNEKSPIVVQHGYTLRDGTVEWLDPDRYLLDSKPTTSNHIVSFSATGLIGSMNGTYYKSTTGEKTLYDMAEAVLLDAGLKPTERGQNPWVIDESLKGMTTTAVLPIDTHANCLQLIAHAGCCKLYTDDENIIHLERFVTSVSDFYSGTWTDNGHTDWSEFGTVDEGGQPNAPVATLEPNRWTLDGTQQILSAEPETGYVGNLLSPSDGAYSYKPWYQKTFDTARDVRLIRLCFDPIDGEWPRRLQAVYYDEKGNIKDAVMVYPSDTTVRIVSEKALGVKRVLFTVFDALPGRRQRLTKAYFRETDFMMDFNTMHGQDYEIIRKTDKLARVDVNKYSYLPEESDLGDLDVEDLDTQYF